MADLLASVIFIVLICLGILTAYSYGANDETIAALVGAHVIRFKIALIVGAVATAIGMIFFSEQVGKSVGADLLGPGIKYTTFMLLAVLMGTILWLIVGSVFGIPLSSTHCTVGGIFGVLIVFAIIQGGVEPTSALNYPVLLRIIIGWFLSPVLALIFTYVVYKILARVYLSKIKGLTQTEKSERTFSYLLVGATILAEIWAGANSAVCIGIFYGLYDSGSITFSEYYLLVVACGIATGIGLYTIGRYVIKNLSLQMADARPSEGFIVLIAVALIMMICTLAGLPISHTHVSVFCIIGVSIAQKKEVDYKAIRKMVMYWFITFPLSGIAAAAIYFEFISLGWI